jgi:hypothetical protein
VSKPQNTFFTLPTLSTMEYLLVVVCSLGSGLRAQPAHGGFLDDVDGRGVEEGEEIGVDAVVVAVLDVGSCDTGEGDVGREVRAVAVRASLVVPPDGTPLFRSLSQPGSRADNTLSRLDEKLPLYQLLKKDEYIMRDKGFYGMDEVLEEIVLPFKKNGQPLKSYETEFNHLMDGLRIVSLPLIPSHALTPFDFLCLSHLQDQPELYQVLNSSHQQPSPLNLIFLLCSTHLLLQHIRNKSCISK